MLSPLKSLMDGQEGVAVQSHSFIAVTLHTVVDSVDENTCKFNREVGHQQFGHSC